MEHNITSDFETPVSEEMCPLNEIIKGLKDKIILLEENKYLLDDKLNPIFEKMRLKVYSPKILDLVNRFKNVFNDVTQLIAPADSRKEWNQEAENNCNSKSNVMYNNFSIVCFWINNGDCVRQFW